LFQIYFSQFCQPGPDKGRAGGECPKAALLVKRRNSKLSFANDPEVRFRFSDVEGGGNHRRMQDFFRGVAEERVHPDM